MSPKYPVFKGDFSLAQEETLKAACRHTYKNTVCALDKHNPSFRGLVSSYRHVSLCNHPHAPVCSDDTLKGRCLSPADVPALHHCSTAFRGLLHHLTLERLTTIVPATISYTVLLCWKNRSVMKAGKKKAIEKFLFKARTVDLQRETETVITMGTGETNRVNSIKKSFQMIYSRR